MYIKLKKEIKTLFYEKDWEKLDDCIKSLENYPGVYIISFPRARKPKKSIDVNKVVFYVGYSNSIEGVKGRLGAFKKGAESSTGHHSAGNRFCKEDCNGMAFTKTKKFNNKHFYVKALLFKNCMVDKKKKRSARSLKTMGKIRMLEYYVMASVLEQTNKEPKLNKQ